ncbi:hypothetical protein [Nakamurella sp. PAMC28650]|uniref:hypothetical protein n=1 Tax=Nakamurella sp. PAMC28650 TaxID=2762325 RepID=UPI00164E591D|nr:hypothetical protein [Nakamurella sp. PAMC28650]QNK82578.1 hypothetical protein H7F38_07690 [Nakamurella sp. PAMC28650]
MTLKDRALQAYDSTMRGESVEAIEALGFANELMEQRMAAWMTAMGLSGETVTPKNVVVTYSLGENDQVDCKIFWALPIEDLLFEATNYVDRLNVTLDQTMVSVTSLLQLGKLLANLALSAQQRKSNW